ncbi:hypothetical protein PV326_007875 [Microctonus aethiopoides]|nr:hypothetical protein PV326_007875 [Microctonus aethiopoides]
MGAAAACRFAGDAAAFYGERVLLGGMVVGRTVVRRHHRRLSVAQRRRQNKEEGRTSKKKERKSKAELEERTWVGFQPKQQLCGDNKKDDKMLVQSMTSQYPAVEICFKYIMAVITK